jgi:hypothetical protein
MNMNLVEMMKDFGDEAKCRAYLEALRFLSPQARRHGNVA